MFQPEKDFEEYGMFVFKYLMSLCGNADLAEELTQETFYRAIRSSGKFDGSCKVSTWLCQIAKHIWYQELDRRRRKKTEPLQENGTGDGLENDYCRKEQTMEVMKRFFSCALRVDFPLRRLGKSAEGMKTGRE